jgi:hypothetical protein
VVDFILYSEEEELMEPTQTREVADLLARILEVQYYFFRLLGTA